MLKILLTFLITVSYSFSFNLPNIGGAQAPSSEKKKNYEELINTLKTSDNGEFLFYLATIYTNGLPEEDDFGKTVKKDINSAIFYYNKSIENGFIQAAAIVGSLFLYNEDFITRPDNVKTAKKFLELAYNNNIFEAAPALSDILMNYDNDTKSAIILLSSCSEKGFATCQLIMGTAYFHGIKDDSFVLEKNEAIANKYLSDACLNKNQPERVKDFCNSSYVIKN